MVHGSRVLVESTRGVFSPAVVLRVLSDGWLRLQLDGERVVHDWHPSLVLDAERILDIAELVQGTCDECGRPEHWGECEGYVGDSNASLGLDAQPGWSL